MNELDIKSDFLTGLTAKNIRPSLLFKEVGTLSVSDRLAQLGKPDTTTPDEPSPTPQTTVDLSLQSLEHHGWVIWQCRQLRGQFVVIIRDEQVTGYPVGYPVYTVLELAKVARMPDATLRLVNEIKKSCRAIVQVVRKERE